MIAKTPTKEELIESVRPMVHAFAHAKARKTGYSADDLAQEAFARICAKFDQYNPSKGQFTTWAGWQARGAILDCLRGSYFLHGGQRTKRTETVCSLARLGYIDDSGEFREQQFEEREQQNWTFGDTASRLMQGCSQRERLLLILMYHEGRTMKDALTLLLIIAAAYGVHRAFQDWQEHRDEQIREMVYRASRRAAENAWVVDPMVLPYPPEAVERFKDN